MSSLYPLKFVSHPLYLPFGGQRLSFKFPDSDKQDQLAEIWELSGHPNHYSVIENGPLMGQNLNQIMASNYQDLLGQCGDGLFKTFPLMVRLLDCNRDLPPAVHPDEKYVEKYNLIEQAKTEAWYILGTDNHSLVYCGNRKELNPDNIRSISERGDLLSFLKKYDSNPKDVFLVPAGRPHTIGCGNLVYELQQTSNAIFPFDWLYWEDKDYQRRADDLNEACSIVLFEDGHNDKISSLSIKMQKNYREILAVTKYFAMEKYILSDEQKIKFDKSKFCILTNVSGEVTLISNNDIMIAMELNHCDTILVPAECNEFKLIPSSKSEVLCSYIPDLENDIIIPLKKEGYNYNEIYHLGGYGINNPFNK